MNAFINGSGIISGQDTYNREALKNGFKELNGNRHTAIEPDYSSFIDARQIRRMSRVIRMGIVAATLASRESGIEKPGGVITGTALGCLEDTNSFLTKQVQQKEEMLSPTAFIHSTHNTISSQVALWFGCRGYNSTYVHRAQSFESALIDAVLLLEEGAVENIIAGGVDEIIDASFTIMDRLGYYKHGSETNKGAIAGEGAAYFALSSKATSTSYARIAGVDLFSFTDTRETANRISSFLSDCNVTEPDLLFTGHNGDTTNDSVYDLLLKDLSFGERIINFKKWSGDYPTATTFGTWLAAEILREKKVPGLLNNKIPVTGEISSILLCNHLEGTHWSLILLNAC